MDFWRWWWRVSPGSMILWFVATVALITFVWCLDPRVGFIERCAEHRPLVECKADAEELFE